MRLPYTDGWSPDRIQAQIDARSAAKQSRNYSDADRIRKELDNAGIVLEDKPGGRTEWRRK